MRRHTLERWVVLEGHVSEGGRSCDKQCSQGIGGTEVLHFSRDVLHFATKKWYETAVYSLVIVEVDVRLLARAMPACGRLVACGR